MLDKIFRSQASVHLKNGETVHVDFQRDVFSFNEVSAEEEGRAQAALAAEIERRGVGDQVDRSHPILIREQSMSDLGVFQRASFFTPSHMRLFQPRPAPQELVQEAKAPVIEVTISAKEDYPIDIEDLPSEPIRFTSYLGK